VSRFSRRENYTGRGFEVAWKIIKGWGGWVNASEVERLMLVRRTLHRRAGACATMPDGFSKEGIAQKKQKKQKKTLITGSRRREISSVGSKPPAAHRAETGEPRHHRRALRKNREPMGKAAPDKAAHELPTVAEKKR